MCTKNALMTMDYPFRVVFFSCDPATTQGGRKTISLFIKCS